MAQRGCVLCGGGAKLPGRRTELGALAELDSSQTREAVGRGGSLKTEVDAAQLRAKFGKSQPLRRIRCLHRNVRHNRAPEGASATDWQDYDRRLLLRWPIDRREDEHLRTQRHAMDGEQGTELASAQRYEARGTSVRTCSRGRRRGLRMQLRGETAAPTRLQSTYCGKAEAAAPTDAVFASPSVCLRFRQRVLKQRIHSICSPSKRGERAPGCTSGTGEVRG